MSNKEKQELIPEKMRADFELIANEAHRAQRRMDKWLKNMAEGVPTSEDQRAQWLHDTCVAGRDALYGPAPSESVRFEVKAAIEQAYDLDIINELFAVYDAAKSSPDAMRAVKLLLYLLGLSDTDPVVK